jgi:UDP-glucose 4-epimerase
LNCIVLRCFNPVGAHPNGKITDGGYGNVVSHICRVAAGKIDNLLIFGNSHDTFDGTRMFKDNCFIRALTWRLIQHDCV